MERKCKILILIDGISDFFEKLNKFEEDVDNKFKAALDFARTMSGGEYYLEEEQIKRGSTFQIHDETYVIKYIEYNNVLVDGTIGLLVERV